MRGDEALMEISTAGTHNDEVRHAHTYSSTYVLLRRPLCSSPLALRADQTPRDGWITAGLMSMTGIFFALIWLPWLFEHLGAT